MKTVKKMMRRRGLRIITAKKMIHEKSSKVKTVKKMIRKRGLRIKTIKKIIHKRRKVKTIKEMTGWSGALPVSICQDIEVLLRITEYDYDLKNRDFEKYCRSRFGFSRATDPKYFEQECNLDITYDEFASYWAKKGETNIALSWEIFNIERGKLQDCWEIYIGRR